MKTIMNKFLIIGGILIVGIALIFFVNKKNTLSKRDKSTNDIPEKEYIPYKYDRNLKRVLVFDEDRQMYYDPQSGALFRPEIGDEKIEYENTERNYEHQVVFDSASGLDTSNSTIKYNPKDGRYYAVPKPIE